MEHVRLCLVVGMVPGGHRHGIVLSAKRFKPRRAGFARFALEALGSFGEGLGFERQNSNGQPCCRPSATASRSPSFSSPRVPVDMGDDQLVSQRMQHLEQHGGVEAATGRHNELEGRSIPASFSVRPTCLHLAWHQTLTECLGFEQALLVFLGVGKHGDGASKGGVDAAVSVVHQGSDDHVQIPIAAGAT